MPRYEAVLNGTTNMNITPQRVSRAISLGFDKMKRIREGRLKILKQYTGRFYQQDGGDDEPKANPLNLIYQGITTLVPNLAFNNPKVKCSTQFMAYRNYGELLELAGNQLIEEIRLRDTIRMVIVDACIMCGWTKVGLGPGGSIIELDDATHDIGMPFADRVDPDDMVIDPMARSIPDAVFIGNRFRVPRDVIMELGIYDNDKIEQLNTRADYPTFPEATMISQVKGGIGMDEINELTDYVDLVEVYFPQEKVVRTIPYIPGGVVDEYLSEVEWQGPEWGPYHQLGFAFVPDNIMPVGPATIWYDLHMMSNRVARRIARQSERNKRIVAYESSAWQDASDVRDADDGEMVKVDDIDAIKEIEYGGTTEDAYRFEEWVQTRFAEAAMNLDLLSGRGSNEPTLGQAEMVQANTSVRLADMQNIVYGHVGDVVKSLLFYLHTDPLIEKPLIRRVNGVEQQVFYTPEMREGDWLDYHITIKPMSMARQDPNLKVRRLMEFFSNVIPAIANSFMMLGGAINLEESIILIGREMGIEDLETILNSPILSAQMEQLRQMIQMGIPLDPSVVKSVMNPMQGAPAGPAGPADPAGGVRPQQPNPGAAMPAGMGPQMEKNQQRQETSAELQGTYGQAQSRNLRGG